jgi:chromosome partitioning protein
MKVITVLNQKGGVGKTTTAYNVGAGLALKGKKVLFIDADAQGNLTYFANAEKDEEKNVMTILRKKAGIDESIQHASGGDVVPSSPELMDADLEIKTTGKESRLKEAFEKMKANYDFVIIDTPPQINVATMNALTASDTCIIPAHADIFSLQGIEQLDDTIQDIRKYCQNPGLKVMGILLTRYRGRTIIAKDIAEVLESTAKKFKTKLFAARIRECNAVIETQAEQKSIFDYAPRSIAAQDYDDLVTELLKASKSATTPKNTKKVKGVRHD